MTQSLSDAALKTALEALLARMGQADSEGDLPTPDKLERMAKAVSAYLKAMEDMAEFNARAEVREKNRTYTRYEDLPPPSPEDRARFIERFKKLYLAASARRGRDGGAD